MSRERLTIIPHGVPYMTKLLRYFVSEDSIFLHLEYVQGEGALSAPQAFGMSSCLILLNCRAHMPSTDQGTQPSWRMMAAGGFCVVPGGQGTSWEDVHILGG